jgi:hypothetical protein
MAFYDATNRSSMQNLREYLEDAPQSTHPALAARILADGLMISKERWVRVAVRFIKWRGNLDDYQAWIHIFSQRKGLSMATDMVNQTAQWITDGEDSGGEGVGGLNQREVDLLARMLQVVKDHQEVTTT